MKKNFMSSRPMLALTIAGVAAAGISAWLMNPTIGSAADVEAAVNAQA